jgi:hypothetical protein
MARRSVLLALCGLLALHTAAQGLEDIFVETYAVSPMPGTEGAMLTTYRIYADLAEGYTLQMACGDEQHRLKIATTTDFFNDTINGGKFGDRVNGDALGQWPAALDTWLTIGAASDMHSGVPKHLDPDGSVVPCPPYADIANTDAMHASAKTVALATADGLVRDTSRREVVDFRFASGYLHDIRGGTLLTVDGAWAMLGGAKGTTPENMVLLAQISTTGELTFQLNLQMAAPDGSVEKHVHTAPAAGEIWHPALSFPRTQ